MIAGVTREYVDTRFGQTHLYRAGPQGNPGSRPLMCFHMSPWSAKYFDAFLGAMGTDRVAIGVDTPGYGNSEQPPAAPDMAAYAGTMGDVADALGFEDFDVFGDRTGAKIALAVAQDQGLRVRHVILNSPVIWTPAQVGARRDYPPEPISPDGSHLSALWRLSVGMSMEDRSLDRFAEIFYTRMQNMHLQHWGRRAAARFDAAAALDAVSGIPVLVLNPNDDLWNVAYRAEPHLHHPMSRIQDLPDWGYGYIRVMAKELAALARKFLDAPDQGGTRNAQFPSNSIDPGDRIARKLCFAEHYDQVDTDQPLAVAYRPGQLCANCAQWKDDRGADSGRCTILYNRMVPAEGWCTVWSMMPF